MVTKRVFSRNADYQKFEVLKTNRNKRYKYRQFFVEGVRNINEALKNGWHVCSFLYARGRPLSGWAEGLLGAVRTDVNYELSVELMEELSGKTDASELMAVIAMRDDDPSKLKLSANPVLALFDRPSNRGNLGTVIRSCDALGVECLVVTGHGVDPYDPDTVVSTMGSFFKVPVLRMADNPTVEGFVERLRADYPAIRVVGTSAHAELELFDIDLDAPVLFLVGNETDGLSNHLKTLADLMAGIPMSAGSSASSLNVGCAATVLFYEAARQRLRSAGE